ncbi:MULTISPECIES: ABC transporter permease [unclassified Novosphingobium]|jgi:cell division transport system permease protein|uniref:cell division protein FtsX n=1 Tax=unclassified Novosphingobium TaxID=2644732 RepID=UPI001CC1F497|nr:MULTISPECIES: FtsX-like permease family protein [unclassified Novosphingobium]
MNVFSWLGAAMADGRRDRAGNNEARLLPEARLSGPMPWVIAIMIALTVVAAASGLALRNAAQTASADVEGGVTVQVVSAAPAERNRQALAALATLRGAPGVVSARVVPQEELNALVEPWLGTRPGDDVEALPIPALLDVRLSGHATPDRIAALRARVARNAPAARVDAQAGWLTPVFSAIHALQWLAGGLIALLALATVAAVLLASRNALGNHRDTIEIVHMLGGTDNQIARIFQRSMAMDAAAGGIVGLLVGLIVVVLLGRQFAALGSGMTTSAGLLWSDWIVIAAIPLAGVALAVVTARVSVLRNLRRML